MKIVLAIDPKWVRGEFKNNNLDAEWGKWDVYVDGKRFYGTSQQTWKFFLQLIEGYTAEELFEQFTKY